MEKNIWITELLSNIPEQSGQDIERFIDTKDSAVTVPRHPFEGSLRGKPPICPRERENKQKKKTNNPQNKTGKGLPPDLCRVVVLRHVIFSHRWRFYAVLVRFFIKAGFSCDLFCRNTTCHLSTTVTTCNETHSASSTVCRIYESLRRRAKGSPFELATEIKARHF